MTLTREQIEFIAKTPNAGMVTVGKDGYAKVVRIGAAIHNGKLWSRSTQDRVRTKRLRRDPRCTLYFHAANPDWLTLETTVTILDGPEVPEQLVAFFRTMSHNPTGPIPWFGKEYDDAGFAAQQAAENSVIYEFEVHKAYGGGYSFAT